MQFRPACTAVSVAGVTIFMTFLLQPTKCNFLRYVCEHDVGGRKRRRGAQGGRGGREAGERARSPGTCGVESIVVGMEGPAVGEGYNERLAISSINIFRRFVTEGRSRRTAAVVARGSRLPARSRRRDLGIIRNDGYHKVLNATDVFFFFASSRPET